MARPEGRGVLRTAERALRWASRSNQQPRCHAEMRVIAFIIDHTVVDKILRHLGRKGEAARERGPPGEADLEAAS